MRIAIPSADPNGLDGYIADHFGRAEYYTFIDLEDKEIKDVKVVKTPFVEHGPGDIPKFVQQNGGNLVIARGMGHRAIEFFQQLGIDVITGAQGKIKDVMDLFIKELLKNDDSWRNESQYQQHNHEHGV